MKLCSQKTARTEKNSKQTTAKKQIVSFSSINHQAIFKIVFRKFRGKVEQLNMDHEPLLLPPHRVFYSIIVIQEHNTQTLIIITHIFC